MNLDMSYSDFIDLASVKNGMIQYSAISDGYDLFFEEGTIIYSCRITDSADVSDFESNHKSAANKPIVPKASDTTPYVRVTEKTVGKMMQLYGLEFTAVANDTTDYEVKWTKDIEFVGATARCNRSEFGDKVQMQIVDVDNILGYGAGFVVTEFGKNVPGKMIESKCDAQTTTAATVMTGLYVRIRYENVSLSEDVIVSATLRYYH